VWRGRVFITHQWYWHQNSHPTRVFASVQHAAQPRAPWILLGPQPPRRAPSLTPHVARPPRSETYQFYSLPFCQPEEGKQYVLEDLGEVLEGDRLVSTPYEIKFREDAEDVQLCSKTLSMRDLEKLRTAIKQDYYFQVGPRPPGRPAALGWRRLPGVGRVGAPMHARLGCARLPGVRLGSGLLAVLAAASATAAAAGRAVSGGMLRAHRSGSRSSVACEAGGRAWSIAGSTVPAPPAAPQAAQPTATRARHPWARPLLMLCLQTRLDP
jgi:hypothetical protein